MGKLKKGRKLERGKPEMKNRKWGNQKCKTVNGKIGKPEMGKHKRAENQKGENRNENPVMGKLEM